MPLVSIVTPCLNMARFIEETIQSVLAQDYPHIEYIVMDGGSKDGTLEILEKYRGRLVYHSSPDSGSADALNRGFQLSRGSILAYLNADDVYLPDAISRAVSALEQNPEAAGIYGDALWISNKGEPLGRYPARPFDPEHLKRECLVCQPASFLRRAAYERTGGFDPALNYTYDYDFWLRLARMGRIVKVDEILACSRMYPENKSLGRRREVFQETIRTLRRNTGYVPFQWVYGYTCYCLDGRDQFFQPLKPSVFKYAVSLFSGLACNRRHHAPLLE